MTRIWSLHENLFTLFTQKIKKEIDYFKLNLLESFSSHIHEAVLRSRTCSDTCLFEVNLSTIFKHYFWFFTWSNKLKRLQSEKSSWYIFQYSFLKTLTDWVKFHQFLYKNLWCNLIAAKEFFCKQRIIL